MITRKHCPNAKPRSGSPSKYKDSALAKIRYDNLLEGGRDIYLYDLLMTHPEEMGGTSAVAPDTYYKKMNIVSMRTSWEDLSDGFFWQPKAESTA